MNQIVETNAVVVAPSTAPANVSAFQQIPLNVVREMVEYIDQAKREIMVEKRDFMTLPGTKKPTLLKPGAEKLLKMFNLGASYEIVEEVQDHLREWEYQKETGKVLKWGKSKSGKSFPLEKEIVKMPTIGWYFYKIRCVLFDQATGQKRGDGLGCFSSNEKPDQPAYTILKMAQKSALMMATLTTCNASDLFTQDLEEDKSLREEVPHENSQSIMPDDQLEQARPERDFVDEAHERQNRAKETHQRPTNNGANETPASDKQIGYIKRMLDEKDIVLEDVELYLQEIEEGMSLRRASDIIKFLQGIRPKAN